jgi:AbrB family looped-hinge helix DNA binding protein
MAGKKDEKSNCKPSDEGCCCNIEAVMSVDDRGQMVLPKDLRTKAGIKTGDKLALVNLETKGKHCCFLLMKIDALSSAVKVMIGPIMKEVVDR